MIADLLKLYPNRKSLPDEPEKLKDIAMSAFSEMNRLNDRISLLEHALFGQSSERMAKKDTGGNETTTEDTQAAEIIPLSANTDETQNDAPEKKTRKPQNRNNHKGRNAFPQHLPRHRVEYDLDQHDKTCPHCLAQLKKIGEETTEQLDVIPAKFFVWSHVRLKYACRHCHQHIALAKMPKQPIHKGSMSAETLAFIAISKYQDFLPLYRIQRQFARQGLDIARSTFANQMESVANLFEPIYDAMKLALLRRKHLFIDATTMPFLDPGAGKTRTGSLWTLVGKEGLNQKALTVYHFTANQQGHYLSTLLKNFTGYIQTDRAPVYDALIKPPKEEPDKIPPCKQVACWAHVRRKFVETVLCHKDSIANEALEWISKLYAIERFMEREQMNDAQRYAHRQEHSKQEIESLRFWLERYKDHVAPSTLLGKAITYATNAWPYLSTFLEEGYLEIDNNRAERAMKPPVIGRKNSLFVGSKGGGKTAAILWSLCETCRQNDINAYDYMVDVMKRLPTHPKDRLYELLPHNWKPPSVINTETKIAA